MRNLIRCKLRNDGPLTIAQKVNVLALSTLFQMKDMTFFFRFSLGICIVRTSLPANSKRFVGLEIKIYKK